MNSCRLRLVSVASSFFDHLHICETRQQLLCQSLWGLRFKSNRVGHALPQCDTIVGAVGRQIEHVTRVEHPRFFRFETSQNLQGRVVTQREVFLLADTPAPLAMHLQQKNIVAVKVWPNTAFVSRITDHDIV